MPRGLSLALTPAVAMAVLLGPALATPLPAQGRPPAVDTAAAAGILSGALVDELPADSINGALLLLPGVGPARGGGLSVRGAGGRETATYLDGIPVTPGSRGVRLAPATNSVDEATVLGGPLSAALGNATAGVILLRTRSTRGARLSYETDDPFGAASLGLNRFEGSFGTRLGRLAIFAGGAVNGQASAESGFGARAAPIFVRAGLDTTVTAGASEVDLFNYAVSRGDCDAFAGSANPGIAGNFGVPCRGDRTPLSALSNHQILLKADYAGKRSTVGVLALRSRDQSRLFNYLTSYLPTNTFGMAGTSELLGITLVHRMRGNGVVRASLSRQTDELLSGPLSAAGELATRDPSLGVMFGRMGFQYDFETFPIDSTLVSNYRENLPGTRRSPYNLENTSQYSTNSQYRTNAYGVTGFAESGGPVGPLTLHREARTVAAAAGDWRVSPNSRFQLGGELTRYEVHQYTHQLTSQAGSDVYIVAPRALTLFAEQVFQYDKVMLSAGVRYERFSSNADRPYALDTVAASPTFNTYQPFPRISSYAGTFNGDSLVTVVRDQSHGAFSPRFRMTFGASPRTQFRAGFSRQAEIPDFNLLYAGVNTDLAMTNARQPFGSDLNLLHAWIGEVGGRHELGHGTSIDLAAFTRSGTTVASRLVQRPDPTRHNANFDFPEYESADAPRIDGGEIRLERRTGGLTGSVGYAYQHASAPSGAAADRPHTVSAAVGFRVHTTAAYAAFRYASGEPYAECEVLGNQSVLSGGACQSGQLINGLSSARLPPIRQLDLRLTQAIRFGGRSITAFLDARNVLNFRNVLQVYVATGTTTSPLEAEMAIAADSSSIANEARANSLYGADGSVDLTFAGGGTAGCAAWRTQAGAAGAPNCVSLIRAEQRFGNGDGVFDLGEQQRAAAAAYAAFHGAQLLAGAPRRIRVGLQIGL